MNILKLSLISILIAVFSGCKSDSEVDLLPENVFKLNIKEPSGLTATNDGKFLITVSDDNTYVYFIDTTGVIKKRIKTFLDDLEGITITGENSFAVISEKHSLVSFYKFSGLNLIKQSIENINLPNKGFEGVAFDSVNGITYIANEYSPTRVIVLDKSLKIINKVDINFIDNISGLHFDGEFLWLLSDLSKQIVKCNKNLKPVKFYSFHIEDAEGITIIKNSIYLVSDKFSKLYKFRIL